MHQSEKELGKKSVKGFLWSTVEIWGGQLIQLAVFIVLARLLGPKDFGLAAWVSVFINLCGLLVGQGLASAIIQRKDLTDLHISSVFWFSLSLAGFASLSLLVAAPLISFWLDEPALTKVLQVGSIIIIFQSFSSIQEAQFVRQLLFKPLALRRTFGHLVGGLVGITMAFNGCGVFSILAVSLTSQFLGAILLWIQSSWRPMPRFSYSSLKELLPFSRNMLGITLLNYASKNSDVFLIGTLLGPVALGFYNIAYRFLTVLNRSTTLVLGRVTFSTFSRLQNNPDALRTAFKTSFHAACLLAFPVYSALAVCAPDILTVVFGEKWAASAPVLRILAITGIFQNIAFFNDSIMSAVNRPHWSLICLILSTSATIIGFILVAKSGLVAISLVLLATTIASLPLTTYLACKLLKISIYTHLMQFAPPLFIAALSAAAVIGIQYFPSGARTSIQNLAIQLTAFGFFYLIGGFALERNFIRSTLGAFFQKAPRH